MKKLIIVRVILGIIVAIILAILIATQFNENERNDKTEDTSVIEKNKAKQDVFETIKLLEPENTLEEINEIIGFEGQCTDEENKVYKWDVTEDTSVKVGYTDEGLATIEISFPSKLIANDKVDFSNFDEVKEAMNTKNSITYDEIVEKFGGVQGTLKYKEKGTLKYEWNRPEGRYLTCTFNSSTMKCTFLSGKV